MKFVTSLVNSGHSLLPNSQATYFVGVPDNHAHDQASGTFLQSGLSFAWPMCEKNLPK